MITLQLVYIANILVAGYIGVVSLFFPKVSAMSIFQNAYPATDTLRLVGCLWFAIALLSVMGLGRPVAMSHILILQFIYKGLWLLKVAVPAIQQQQDYPSGMALFFLVWVLVLPFVIPWATVFAAVTP